MSVTVILAWGGRKGTDAARCARWGGGWQAAQESLDELSPAALSFSSYVDALAELALRLAQ